VYSADGHTGIVYPELPYRSETVSVEQVNGGIGINESADSIASLLTRMCLRSVASEDKTSIQVEVIMC